MTLYHGHKNGEIERREILSYVEKLDFSKYYVLYIMPINQKNCPPEMVLITKRK